MVKKKMSISDDEYVGGMRTGDTNALRKKKPRRGLTSKKITPPKGGGGATSASGKMPGSMVAGLSKKK